ncbi:F0F1 ATP synthase subunit B family protein [Verrucomicrobiota bacterium sgz303538]
MLIDWFTVAAQIVNFVVLVWLLKRFLYRPVLAAMAAREQRVRETVAAADRQKAESETEAARLREQQAELARQKEALLKTARDEATAARDAMLAQARKEINARAGQWREALAREWKEFRAELAQRTQDEALAIARLALRELADTDIEERMTEAFLKKLAALEDEVKTQIQALAGSSTRPLLVRSGFPIAEPMCEKLRRALHEQFATMNDVQFETAPRVIAGIEVSFDGQKLAWTLDDFLHSLEANVNSLIQKETHADAPAH